MNGKVGRSIQYTPNHETQMHKNNCIILVTSRTTTKYIQDHENMQFYPNTANSNVKAREKMNLFL